MPPPGAPRLALPWRRQVREEQGGHDGGGHDHGGGDSLRGCENTIRTALSRVEGVRSVQPDHRTNQVKIAYDEARTDEGSLREILAGLGFDPVAA